ncbi:MAG: envelope stress response membrane protein PspC [Alphaproteobacteria bacterium]|nr:envelope stress response membrane protein PspC [Alphaproteobacteria bacterium]
MTNFKERPTKLYKIPQAGKVMGVCAGVADYFDIKVGVVRVLTIVGILVTFPWLLIGYFILGMALDPKPGDLYRDEREEEFWKQTRKSPDYTAAELRRRFRDIERRTSEMEAYMTSKRFRLERELRALED